MAAGLASTPNPLSGQTVRVMVVDDSVVVRGLTARWLEEAGFSVVGTAANGRAAVDLIDRAKPDIILLDLEMPEMDGFEALPLLLSKRPGVSIIVISTLTQRNAQVSLKCLSLGAVDYLAKPENHRGVTTSASFRQELVAKVQGLGQRHRRTVREPTARAPDHLRVPSPAVAHEPARARIEPQRMVRTRPMTAPRCLLVGASTGGPRAVGEFITALAPSVRHLPICIVQHMPPIFTAVFAEHLAAQCGLSAAEGQDGERLQPGRIYVAPGGRHMGLKKDASGTVSIRLDDGAPENFCRPAVDVLFRDAAAVFGGACVAVVLTGMGSDGTIGAQSLVAAGAPVIAQDEASSTVWGMPGSIAKAGLAHDILPLPAIAPAVKGLLIGGAA